MTFTDAPSPYHESSGAAEPEIVKLVLPSVPGYEKVARGAAEAIAHQMGFSPDRIEDLKTAVSEACMNAIEHGNNLERTAMVTVLLTAAPSKLEVRVEDAGRQSVPDLLPDPGMGAMRGWGFFFIQQLMDEVEITRLPGGGNQVRMVITLTPPARAKADPDASAES